MSIGLTLLLLEAPSRRRQALLAATLVALFFTHIFRYPFALCAVVGTAVVMYPATRRIRPIALPLVPALALMGTWLLVRPKEVAASFGPLAIHKERMKELPGYLTGAFNDPAEHQAFDAFFRIVLVVGVLSIAIAIVGATVVPLACAVVFLGLFLWLPMSIGIWWYVYPREATAATFIALGAFPNLPRSFWLRFPLV